MNNVKLKLNSDKTDFIIIDHKHTRESRILKFYVIFLQSSITQAEEVKKTVDSFDGHISKFCCACHYHLRDLQCVHKFLTVNTAVLVANAIVSNRLDYCNPHSMGPARTR